jgi:copper chaperone NosL
MATDPAHVKYLYFSKTGSLKFNMKDKNCFCLLLILVLTACNNSSTQKTYTPHTVTRDDIGYYCNMIVEDHAGPKGQILLTNTEKAIWFTSIRDAIAFAMLPDEPKNIASFFVTAMDETEWDHPEKQTSSWIYAQSAWYVINSEQRGGMGQREVIPFKQQQSASDFVETHGGEIVSYIEIPRNYILGNTH